MATLTIDKPIDEAKARVMDAVKDAKRAVVRGKHQLEDLQNTAEYRIKKAPLASVGIGFAAGVVLGALFGVVAVKAAKKESKASACC